MPVEFTDGALLQMLLRTSNVVTLGQIRSNLLPSPAAREDVGLGVGETPLQIGDVSVVSALLAQVVWILQVDGVVRAPCANVRQFYDEDVVDFSISYQKMELPFRRHR